jgi:hypothetical protein
MQKASEGGPWSTNHVLFKVTVVHAYCRTFNLFLVLVLFHFWFCFEVRSHYGALAGLELIHDPPASASLVLNYRPAPPHPAYHQIYNGYITKYSPHEYSFYYSFSQVTVTDI